VVKRGAVRKLLQRVGATPALEPTVATCIRARALAPSLGFILGEVRHRGERAYTVRGTDVACFVEHGTTDVPTLDQAFIGRYFEPPIEVAPYLATIADDPIVLDLGANIGLWSVWAGESLRPSRTIAVEPIPRNCRLLARNLELNPRTRGDVICAAAGTEEGSATFAATTFTTGRLSGDENQPDGLSVRVIDTLDLMQTQGVTFLKMDIEGGEWPILTDPRFAESDVVVMFLEFHPHGSPSGDAARDAESLLRQAGFQTTEPHTYSDAGDGGIWAWR
jgi:FkbM family methyltransferase